MTSTRQYGVALLVGGAATAVAGLARQSDPVFGGTGPVTLAAVGCLYAATGLLVTRHPELVWGRRNGSSLAAGVFGGGLTFGGTTLAAALAPPGYPAAVALGLGLGVFGFAVGHWNGTDADPESATE
ncbi:hypothetical protein [Halobaculum sp. MBLA0143]|uniref:hypothetical protein n=1 Tax=Halobaculum sp. MBLA0143 TaxID=3079933 RepID=UPI003526405B